MDDAGKCDFLPLRPGDDIGQHEDGNDEDDDGVEGDDDPPGEVGRVGEDGGGSRRGCRGGRGKCEQGEGEERQVNHSKLLHPSFGLFSERGFKGVWTQRLRGEGNF